MLRVGIMTTQDALNNGAMLQAFALQNYLESLGHEVEFIDFKRERKLTIRSFISKNPFRMWNKWKDIAAASYFRIKGHFGDLLKRGNVSYFSLKNIQGAPPVYDIYIAGSDQIWNVSSKNTINKAFYLDFGNESVKRISYAASMGQCNVPEFLNEEIFALLQKFDAISLREAKAVNYVQSLFKENRKIYHTPDPTFLLSSKEYIMLALPKIPQGKYIASYILVPNKFDKGLREAVDFITHHKGIELINLRNPDTCVRLKNAQNIIVTPKKWLSYVCYSEFMVCCSFHAVVFSLIFHKPFVVVSPYKNERIFSLLNPIGLNGRIVMDFDEDKLKKIMKEEIDWQKVDGLLKKQKLKGTEFLHLSLH